MTWQMDGIWLWSARGMSPGPTRNKRHKHPTGAEDSLAYEWVEKGDEWNSTVASVFFWGDAIPQHTQGASQRSEVTRLLNALNIGGLIGSVEKGDPDSARVHTYAHAHAHKISRLLLPNDLATAENRRNLLTAQVWQWISLFRDGPN